MFPPDEILIKYGPASGMPEKYAFVEELTAEARSKLNPLEIYRLKIPETDLLPANWTRQN